MCRHISRNTRSVHEASTYYRPMTDLAGGPVFIGCSHGTDDQVGRAAVHGLLDAVRRERPSLDVREAFVDVQGPAIDEVVAGIEPGRPVVIVPLLLSAGYHVHVDIARAAAPRPQTVVASTLGPDPRLARILVESLLNAGTRKDDCVILAAAGSSDDRALRDIDAAAELLHARLGREYDAGVDADSSGRLGADSGPNIIAAPVVAYAAGGKPSIREAIAGLRAGTAPGRAGSAADGSRRVAIASYLLAPGFFASRVDAAGADIVTPPLLPAATAIVAEIALDRFDDAIAAAPDVRSG